MVTNRVAPNYFKSKAQHTPTRAEVMVQQLHALGVTGWTHGYINYKAKGIYQIASLFSKICQNTVLPDNCFMVVSDESYDTAIRVGTIQVSDWQGEFSIYIFNHL